MDTWRFLVLASAAAAVLVWHWHLTQALISSFKETMVFESSRPSRPSTLNIREFHLGSGPRRGRAEAVSVNRTPFH